MRLQAKVDQHAALIGLIAESWATLVNTGARKVTFDQSSSMSSPPLPCRGEAHEQSLARSRDLKVA